MSHRFHDLFEAGENQHGLSVKDRAIAIGTNYMATLIVTGKDSDYGTISIVKLESSRVLVAKIEILACSSAARYYHKPEESSRYQYLLHSSLDPAPFFDYMKENHQEVAEWLLWYL